MTGFLFLIFTALGMGLAAASALVLSPAQVFLASGLIAVALMTVLSLPAADGD